MSPEKYDNPQIPTNFFPLSVVVKYNLSNPFYKRNYSKIR